MLLEFWQLPLWFLPWVFLVSYESGETRIYQNSILQSSIVTEYMNIPANIYLFKVINRDTRKRCEIYSELTIKTTKTTSTTSFWGFYCYLWTYFTPFSSVYIVDFAQKNVSWNIFKKIIYISSYCPWTVVLKWRPICSKNCCSPIDIKWSITLIS